MVKRLVYKALLPLRSRLNRFWLKWQYKRAVAYAECEQKHAEQALHNLQWYKLTAATIKYQLEDMSK